jgi:hypothetical protein
MRRDAGMRYAIAFGTGEADRVWVVSGRGGRSWVVKAIVPCLR